jgi:O-antigen ligase
MNFLATHINRDKLTLWLLIAVPASVYLPIQLSSAIIIIATANAVFRKDIFINIKQLFNNKLALVLITSYLIIIVSALLSANKTEAFANLERKLSYLIFPILFSLTINATYIKKITISFFIATVLAVLYSLVNAYIKYNSSGDIKVFFYHQLASALNLNAIYFSIYCAFSLFVVLCYYQHIRLFNRYIGVFFVVVLFSAIVLLSSKNILFVTLAGVLFYFVRQAFLARFKWLVWFLVGVPIVLIWLIKPVKERFLVEINSKMEVIHLDSFRYDTPFSGFTLRLVIWKNCWEILKEKKAWWFGVGVGDFQDLLNSKYISKGIYTGNKQLGDTGYLGYGPHNQWIENLLSMGIIGLVFLLSMVIIMVNKFYSQNHLLGLLFVFIFISICFTESVLSTNKGVIFFLYFSGLLYAGLGKIKQ